MAVATRAARGRGRPSGPTRSPGIAQSSITPIAAVARICVAPVASVITGGEAVSSRAAQSSDDASNPTVSSTTLRPIRSAKAVAPSAPQSTVDGRRIAPVTSILSVTAFPSLGRQPSGSSPIGAASRISAQGCASNKSAAASTTGPIVEKTNLTAATVASCRNTVSARAAGVAANRGQKRTAWRTVAPVPAGHCSGVVTVATIASKTQKVTFPIASRTADSNSWRAVPARALRAGNAVRRFTSLRLSPLASTAACHGTVSPVAADGPAFSRSERFGGQDRQGDRRFGKGRLDELRGAGALRRLARDAGVRFGTSTLPAAAEDEDRLQGLPSGLARRRRDS